MTINHKLISESNGIRVIEFIYSTPVTLNLDVETINEIENAFERAIGNVVGNNIHSVYSPHNNNGRYFERVVIIGDTNALT